MGVGGHKAEALDRAHIHSHVGGVTVALACVLKNESLRVVPESSREDRAVVRSVPSCETFDRKHAPVRNRHASDRLVTVNGNETGSW